MENLFEMEEQKSGFYELDDTTKSVARGPDMVDAYIAIRSQTTGRPYDEVKAQIGAFDPSFFEAEDKSRVVGDIGGYTRARVSDAAAAGDLNEVTAAMQEGDEATQRVMDSDSPEVFDITNMAPGALWDRNTQLLASRKQTLAKVLSEEYEAQKVTVPGLIWDIADIILSAPLDGLTLAGFGRNDEAQRIRQLISDPSLTEKEFGQEVRNAVRSMADSGYLTDSNTLFLLGGIANIQEGGIGGTREAEIVGNVLDFGFGAASVLKGVKNTTALIGKMRGSEAAGNHLRQAVNSPGTQTAQSAGVPRQASPSLLRPIEAGGTQNEWIAPHARVGLEVVEQNRIFDLALEEKWAKLIDTDELGKHAPALMEQVLKNTSARQRNRILDLNVEDIGLSNLVGKVRWGKLNGEAFLTEKSAQKHADLVGGRVVQVGEPGGEARFAVEKEYNLSASGLVDKLDVSEIGFHIARSIGSTFLALPERLRVLAFRGENSYSSFASKVRKAYEKDLKAVSKDEREVVEMIFKEMRDGPRFAEKRQPLTMQGFRNEWANLRPGTKPSEAAENLYQRILEVNDTAYILKADPILKEMVDRGVEMLTYEVARKDGVIENIALPVQTVTREELEAGTKVRNLVSGVETTLEDTPKGETIYRAVGGFDVGDGRKAKYISTSTPKTRRLYHSDVLGYNAGGPRTYESFNYFVKQAKKVLFTDRTEAPGNPLTILATFSREEAKLAVDNLNSLFTRLEELGNFKRHKSMSKAVDAIKALRATPEAEQAVVEFNKWNTSIEDIDGLVEYLKKNDIDPRTEFGLAAKDDLLALPDDVGELTFGLGKSATYGDDFLLRMNSPRNSARRDEPLVGLDGQHGQTVSPLDTIQNDFLKVSHGTAFQTFNSQSITAWLKGAQNYLDNFGEVQNLRPFQQLERAVVNTSSPEGRAYKAAQDHLKRIMGQRSEWEKKWESTVSNIAEFVYDKGYDKLGKGVFNARTVKNPIEFFRGLVFDARLGMFDPAQLIVQASQTFNILAITGRPANWLQDMVMHTPLRVAMETDNPEILRAIAQRAAPLIGMSPDEFLSFQKFVKESGRLNVGAEVAERSSVDYTMAQGFVGKVREAGRIFFNEGEKLPRSVSLAAAWREYAKKGLPMDTEAARNWMMARSDTLTAGMTRTSAAAWQKGPASIPLQFMTYSGRMLEALFTNRVLTGAERARLGVAQIALWGAAGTGLGQLYDYYLAESGLEWDEQGYTLLRYGALDALLQATTGTQAVFGDRIAFAEGFTQLLRNISEDKFLEVIAGPSGGLVSDTFFTVMEGFRNAVVGNSTLLRETPLRLIRNITGPNKMYNAWRMYTLGDYTSRNGDTLVGGLTAADAVLHTLGGQIRDANLGYTYLQVMENQDAMIKEHTKRIRAMHRSMQEAADRDDWTTVYEIEKEIAAEVGFIPSYAQDKVMFALQGQFDSFAESMFEKLVTQRMGGRLRQERGEEE